MTYVIRTTTWTAGVILELVCATAHAQWNRDYYQPDINTSDRELRRNVESYHLGPGIQYMREQKWSGAKAHFEFILRYYPNHPSALNQISELCDVHWVDPRCDSESWMSKAIEVNPGNAQTYVVYGLHLQRRKKVDQAVLAFNKALSINPKSLNAHYNLGLVYLEQKQYSLANRHAQVSYALGMQLPGLRNLLKSAGKWNAISEEEIRSVLEPVRREPLGRLEAHWPGKQSLSSQPAPGDSGKLRV